MKYKPSESEKQKARTFGATLAVVFNGLLVLFFVITAAWTPPDPPVPDFGIEVAFGFDTPGSSDRRSTQAPNPSESFDEPRPQPTPVEPVPEAATPPAAQPTPTAPSQVTGVTATSEQSVKADPEPTKPKPEPTKPKVEEEKREEPKPEPKVNPATTLGGTGSSNTPQASNTGDTNTPGSAGDPTGRPNANTTLGRNTGQGGSSLSMPGWRWESPPIVNDNSSATGTITFEVRIDNQGEVISVVRKYSDIVDRNVVQAYQEAIRNLVFVQENTSATAPRITTGQITFVITTR